MDTVGTWVAFGLTVLVFCYLGKEIPFLYAVYRVVAYLFVGVALGYGAVLAWHGVLVPRLFRYLGQGKWFYVVPLLLCLLLLSRVRRSWQSLSQLPIAFLFGVGTALAVGGALVGTLMPQVEATFVSLNPAHYRALGVQEGTAPAWFVLDALLVAVGTVGTLLTMYFTVGRAQTRGGEVRNRALQVASGIGKVFIVFTFGALYATTAVTRVALLVDRVRFLIEVVRPYVLGL
ncbi:MAG: hypothetical protein JXA09_12350 [Anaerolineae bacterium]|nr:hypothetical protein [Anaerolineae bacterium]